MPTPTYVPLATYTVPSATASVVFSSIPATYRDLILVVSGSASAGGSFALRFNSDSGSNYSYLFMSGTGSTFSSGQEPSVTVAQGGGLSTIQSNTIFQIMDYSATDKHKTMLSRQNRSDSVVRAFAARWFDTAAITTVETVNITFNTGTTLSLYGIA